MNAEGFARNRVLRWAVGCPALGLLLVLSACGGDSGSTPPLTVSVTSASSTVGAGASAQVTATVANDSSNAGVTWTVSCSSAPCGSVAPSATLSGVAATYTAPAASNSSGFTVTIIATAVNNPAVSGSLKLGISEPIRVSVSTPNPTTLLPSVSVQVTATVVNDAAKKGVSWSVSCNASPCGTVSPATTASGVAATYTAPQGLAPSQTVTITATSVSESGVAANTSVQIGWSIQINVVPSPATVAGGATAQIMATLLNDPLGGGFSWTASCSAASCGSVSPASSASGATVTYTAPTPPPPTGPPLQVTVTATSATSASVQASVSVEVPAVTVGVVPISVLLPLNTSQQFSATVGYDAAEKGVTWALSQNGAICSPACGTVSPASTASGGSTTYSPPASLPANPTVVLTAASVTEPASSVTASITLTNGSVKLVPADMSFGGCYSRACPQPPQVAVLTNTGPSVLSISGLTIGGSSAGDFAESNTCSKTLAAAASCNISVTYKSSKKGEHTAVLSIADSSPDSPQQLFLTGNNKASVNAAALHESLRDQSITAVPRPTGNSQVGTRVMHWVDGHRMDPYRGDGTKRELMVRFWYPTSGAAACTPADYTSLGVWTQFSQLLRTPLPQVSTNSCLNAPVESGAHAVVLVTPGFTGTFTDYTFLTEDLASRGYVVVAVDHTYEATAVEFPDGRLEQGIFGSFLTSYTRSDPQALAFAVSVRLADLRFVVNQLTTLNNVGNSAFAGKLDLSRLALVGHSLGGLTTVRGVEKDKRFRAGISLDGLVPDHLTLPTTTPVLVLRAGTNWNENDCQLWSALQGVRAAVNLNGMEHVALSDAVWIGNGAVATGPMGIDKTIAAVRETSAAFLEAAFNGTSTDVPAFRSLMSDPNAVVTMQGQSPCSRP